MENPDTRTSRGQTAWPAYAVLNLSLPYYTKTAKEISGLEPPITVFYDILRRIINYLPYPALAAQRFAASKKICKGTYGYPHYTD